MANFLEPEITADLRKEAARNPGGWVYVVDPYFSREDDVPPYGIEGAWAVDDSGEITGSFRRNEKYRPSPQKLRLPVPGDPVEATAQLVATGYEKESKLKDILLAAEVFLLVDSASNVPVYTDDKGDFVVMYSSPGLADGRGESVIRMGFLDSLSRIPQNVTIVLNPGSGVTVRLPASDFLSL